MSRQPMEVDDNGKPWPKFKDLESSIRTTHETSDDAPVVRIHVSNGNIWIYGQMFYHLDDKGEVDLCREFHLDDLPRLLQFVFQPEIYNALTRVHLYIQLYYAGLLYHALRDIPLDGLKEGIVLLEITGHDPLDDIIHLYQLPGWSNILTKINFCDTSARAMEIIPLLSRKFHRLINITSNSGGYFVTWMSRDIYTRLLNTLPEFDNLTDLDIYRMPDDVYSVDIWEPTRKIIPRCIRLKYVHINARWPNLSCYSQSVEVRVVLALLSVVQFPRLRQGKTFLSRDLIRLLFDCFATHKCPG